MKEFIKERCDLMIRDKQIINKNFLCEFDIMEIVGSLILSGEGMEVDKEKLKECKKILSKNVSCFSCIRGIGRTLTICKMAISDDPQKYIDDLEMVYKKIMKGRFFNGEYMVLAASNVCDNGKVSEADRLTEKFNEIDDRMKKEHPILTGAEDWSLAMLLAMSDKSVDSIINEMEEGYRYMRDMKFRATSNGLQALTQVLSLMGGGMESKCDKVIRLSDKFREKGVRYGKEYEVAALGTLTDIDADEETLVSEIIETAEYLRKAKGFGVWHLDKKTRIMFATLIVAESYEKNHITSSIRPQIETGAITSAAAVSVAAAITMILIVCVCCSSSSSH